MGIKVLDCTLRDGAYIVNSSFGDKNIKEIITALNNAKIDIIECGWLRDATHKKDSVIFAEPNETKEYINLKNSKYALMFDYGKYDINKLNNNNGLIDIIRIAFYKKNIDEISFLAEKAKSKGYQVFLQPSNIKEYSYSEIEKLCKRANFVGVDAVYIVDSFGSLFPEDLDNIIPVFDETVNPNIEIGFHSHNNLQLSLALSIKFINSLKRNIIIDSSLSGIGRCAGNTKTEILLEYLNRFYKTNYNQEFIWKTLEKNITPLYKKFSWEYTPQKGLLGIKNLHP